MSRSPNVRTPRPLSVVNLVKQNLAKFQSVLPSDVKVSYEFDQSPYVTRAIPISPNFKHIA